ncbi:hypothetical protein PNOK_0636500 [Pyrrhoderma noxium]|uniref:SHSP domain-containing protein n=1 Tax=Pyrrhoderma noxium TaxID=2282107 RepID=A0A286UED0_9AGAM|nr:hypothetical protein PNOK_0636500 [Pyrrhoderma noxium]
MNQPDTFSTNSSTSLVTTSTEDLLSSNPIQTIANKSSGTIPQNAKLAMHLQPRGATLKTLDQMKSTCVVLELPGFSPDDITIKEQVNGDLLVEGKRKYEDLNFNTFLRKIWKREHGHAKPFPTNIKAGITCNTMLAQVELARLPEMLKGIFTGSLAMCIPRSSSSTAPILSFSLCMFLFNGLCYIIGTNRHVVVFTLITGEVKISSSKQQRLNLNHD